jgi:hypothetical protein
VVTGKTRVFSRYFFIQVGLRETSYNVFIERNEFLLFWGTCMSMKSGDFELRSLFNSTKQKFGIITAILKCVTPNKSHKKAEEKDNEPLIPFAKYCWANC